MRACARKCACVFVRAPRRKHCTGKSILAGSHRLCAREVHYRIFMYVRISNNNLSAHTNETFNIMCTPRLRLGKLQPSRVRPRITDDTHVLLLRRRRCSSIQWTEMVKMVRVFARRRI